jgi:hypothetical protein
MQALLLPIGQDDRIQLIPDAGMGSLAEVRQSPCRSWLCGKNEIGKSKISTLENKIELKLRELAPGYFGSWKTPASPRPFISKSHILYYSR